MQVAQWEREVIGERTRAGLAEKRADGWRPAASTADEERERVLELHRRGLSGRAITARLNAEGGKRWHLTTVQRLVRAAT